MNIWRWIESETLRNEKRGSSVLLENTKSPPMWGGFRSANLTWMREMVVQKYFNAIVAARFFMISWCFSSSFSFCSFMLFHIVKSVFYGVIIRTSNKTLNTHTLSLFHSHKHTYIQTDIGTYKYLLFWFLFFVSEVGVRKTDRKKKIK